MSNKPKPAESVQPVYLSMIQGNVSRMATASAIFKGFAATIIAGIVTIAFDDINPWVLLVMALPIAAFLMLDVYYLSLEKKYRYLYEKAALGNFANTFTLDVKNIDSKAANAGIVSCLKSLSITLFYGPVALAFLILVIMRFMGV